MEWGSGGGGGWCGTRRVQNTGNLASRAVKENQNRTVVKAVKTDFVQKLLKSGEKRPWCGVGLGSVPDTAWAWEDAEWRGVGRWMEDY